MHDRPSRIRVLAAFAAIYIIWGSTYLAIRIAIDTIPPFLMAGMRFVIAGTALYAWARARGAAAPERRHWLGAGAIGLLLLAGGNGGVVWAEQRVPTGLAALLVAMVPVWTVLVDWLRPGGERPRGRVILGLLVGFAGVILLIAPGHIAGGTHVNPLGALALMAGSLSWSIGSVYSKRVTLPRSPQLATAMEMLVGGAGLLVGGSLAGELGRVHPSAISGRSVLAVLYLIVFGSLIAFSAFVWLLRVSTPARVSTYAYVNPAVAVLLGWGFANEPLTPRTLVAAAIIVAAVVLITSAAPGRPVPRPKQASAPEPARR
ncbi:MAG: drug/metabolite exporter YedA [Gemmatimonadales bacterium]|nr:drug/metabolite exporter YedA [Gemmatimonadales bacterium]